MNAQLEGLEIKLSELEKNYEKLNRNINRSYEIILSNKIQYDINNKLNELENRINELYYLHNNLSNEINENIVLLSNEKKLK